MNFKSNICLLVCSLALSTASLNYEGYKIYETIPKHQSEADFLNKLSGHTEEIDFFILTKLPNVPARVMVSPKYQEGFENNLNNNGMEFSVINSDVSKSIKEEKLHNNLMRSSSRKFGFTKYHRLDEINNYLDELHKTLSPRVFVGNVTSYEGRPIKMVCIGIDDCDTEKKFIFIDAGIHAREWIAPATAMYIIQELAENPEKYVDLLTDFNWLIIPVANPDGYEYTHTDSRFWRKSRALSGESTSCVGTDGNRNFDFHWGEVGASSDPCSDTYKGSKAFSEPETEFIRDYLHLFHGRGLMYLTLHSYGNYILYPWGYTSFLPTTWRSIDEVAQVGANAIKNATGSHYTVGSSANVLYAAAGSSADYSLGVTYIPISLTMELPSGGSGFDPHPSQIKESVEESFIGIRAMVLKIKDKFISN